MAIYYHIIDNIPDKFNFFLQFKDLYLSK